MLPVPGLKIRVASEISTAADFFGRIALHEQFRVLLQLVLIISHLRLNS
jgi:hypothetical protein